MKHFAGRWMFVVGGCVLTATLVSSARGDDTPASHAVIDAAVARSLPLLQASARTWSQQRDCSSCHHQSLGTLAVEVARERGFAVDAAAAREQAAFTLRSRDEGASVDTFVRGRATTGGGQMGLSYALTGLTALRWPADRVTDVLTHFIAGRQFPDGKFPSPDRRPPHEDSDVAATALAVRALRAYGRDRQEVDDRIRRAAAWLTSVDARTTEDQTMQLLGLRWAGAAPALQRTLQQRLVANQRDDGGWAQIPTRASDAYATGQVLVALNQTGVSAESAAYRRGVAFLVRTQHADGSWHVTTRRKDEIAAGQAYFETGFPHGRDQFISYAGSAWATMALSLTRAGGLSPALTDVRARPRRVPADDGDWTEGTTPLMKAALRETPASVRRLLQSGADPNVVNAEGTTALMWAGTRGLAWVRPLLDRGANPKAADKEGFTPLMFAAGHSGPPDVLRALLAAGADVNALSRRNWSAVRDAVKAGDPAKLRLLLQHGATLLISRPTINRMTLISVSQDDIPILTLLLDRGLDPSHAQDGYTGLMAAAGHGLEQPLRLLLARGADPNKVESGGGFTALMYAALSDPGHDRIVRALVTAGAKLDAKSHAGLTAADYAAKHGYAHLLALLRPLDVR
jgi:ankyrin repeat protein